MNILKLISISSIFILFCFSGCKQNKSTDIKPSDIVEDTQPTQNVVDEYVEEQELIHYSQKELNTIMDSLNRILASGAVSFQDILMYAVADGHIEVILIDSTRQTVEGFRNNIMDSPAIRFKQALITKPDGKECSSCGFTMFVSPESYTLPVDTINVIIKNDSSKEGTAGKDFYVEYLENKEWKPVRLNYGFNSIGYILQPYKSSTFSIDLQTKLHTYQAGRYRIYKTVIIDKEIYILHADFYLK